MADTNTGKKKVVTTENLAALKEVLPTKTQVTTQLEQAIQENSVVFATNEEVLALFQETAPASTPSE